MRRTPNSYGTLLASMGLAAGIPPELLPEMRTRRVATTRDPERERREAQAREVREWNQAVEDKRQAKKLARTERKRG